MGLSVATTPWWLKRNFHRGSKLPNTSAGSNISPYSLLLAMVSGCQATRNEQSQIPVALPVLWRPIDSDLPDFRSAGGCNKWGDTHHGLCWWSQCSTNLKHHRAMKAGFYQGYFNFLDCPRIPEAAIREGMWKNCVAINFLFVCLHYLFKQVCQRKGRRVCTNSLYITSGSGDCLLFSSIDVFWINSWYQHAMVPELYPTSII